jgi:hypothetical protein
MWFGIREMGAVFCSHPLGVTSLVVGFDFLIIWPGGVEEGGV